MKDGGPTDRQSQDYSRTTAGLPHRKPSRDPLQRGATADTKVEAAEPPWSRQYAATKGWRRPANLLRRAEDLHGRLTAHEQRLKQQAPPERKRATSSCSSCPPQPFLPSHVSISCFSRPAWTRLLGTDVASLPHDSRSAGPSLTAAAALQQLQPLYCLVT